MSHHTNLVGQVLRTAGRQKNYPTTIILDLVMLAKAVRQLATRQRHSARKLTGKLYFFPTDNFSQIFLNCFISLEKLILSYIWRGLKGALFNFVELFCPGVLILLPLPRRLLLLTWLGWESRGLEQGHQR